MDIARTQARVAYEKDKLYRQWNVRQGAVYMPVTKETPPNPRLSDMPERDIKTPSGKLLTLMYPACMTFQVVELAVKEFGVYGHITSQNPIRLENVPDPWEAEALLSFEHGKTEISSVENTGGKQYMRLMRPLIVEKECLVCHAKQGYRTGDIRGGISVSIPMESLRSIERRHIITFTLAHGMLWLVGMSIIGLWRQRQGQSERKLKRMEEALRESEERFKTLNDIWQLFQAGKTLESIFAELPKILSLRFQFPVAAIELYDEVARNMVFVGSVGISTEGPRPMRVPIDQTISGTVATTCRAVCELKSIRRAEYKFTFLGKLSIETFVCVPMKIRGHVLGTLALGDIRERQDAVSIMSTLQVIANHLAQEIEYKRVEEALQASEEKYRYVVEAAHMGIWQF